ncbi:MAG: pseudouridine-5'-phosphate glycosidase [Bacteroidales bacterium]|jgi:pseudouridine-5'-phosphate glycosidase|nr:pseudouridine-5'-phosphate glycosidase [Bacteroidales bacterium]MDG2081115.1 pseudouridine-5'-phosphate glycosidase [Bacteroidales bacterium]|tara:strand:- start:13300 stop:14220 length:921 start_codon:yes stop_codon:yes gene_type:complete
MKFSDYLDIHPNVQEAIKNGDPIVALESTIISHGMPYPKNIETAIMVEETVRSNKAIPATIAIINGRLKVGLTHQEIEYLATNDDVRKVSRRDLAITVSQKQSGSTTVAATMIIANLAEIAVFATGGIGGVHRGAEKTLDISADLEELSNTNVCVVCSGAKAILDIGLTLEYLETKGVPVIGYKTSELPAFYSSESGFDVDYKIDSALEIAAILKTKWNLGVDGGVLVANPIPVAFELESSIMNEAINQAIIEADKENITGKNITPFLLSKVSEITEGKSLDANIKLIQNNADLAAKIALHYSKQG